MTIRLVTGLPGSGKSLYGVSAIKSALDEGRNVYVDGLDGLVPFGWEACDANAWQDLPDGSLVVIDEAQKKWPTRRTAEPPECIRALSEHRHRGFDFLLITQHPTMLDAYVRKLVNGHVHLIRQHGAQLSKIIGWQECQDDPQSQGTRERGTVKLWRYPRDLFPLYKSATLHTMKRKLPLRIYGLAALVVVLVGLGWFGLSRLHSIEQVAQKSSGVVPASSSAVSPGSPAGAAEYAQNLMARVPGMPWSAPIFDDRKTKSEPDIYCIDSAKGCRCYTEQITRMVVPVMQCMQIARDGVYNPYREPFDKKAQQQRPPADGQDRGGSSSVVSSVFGRDPSSPEAGTGRDLKVSDANGGERERWPRPDFSYRVPFPDVGSAKH
jgi:hypothetical protein